MKTYRKGNISDLEEIKKVTLMANSQYENMLSEENMLAWKNNMTAEKTYTDLFETAVCFVCENENKIIGSAFLIPHGNPYKWFEAEWSYIRLVAVDTKHEGKGIGKSLTQMCIDFAKQSGEKVIALHTSEFQNAARHIYESMGFEKLKDLDLLFGKRYYLYTLQLN